MGDMVVTADWACIDPEVTASLLLACLCGCDGGALGLIGNLSATLAHIRTVTVSHNLSGINLTASIAPSRIVIRLLTLWNALAVLTHCSHFSLPPDMH